MRAHLNGGSLIFMLVQDERNGVLVFERVIVTNVLIFSGRRGGYLLLT